MNKSARRVSCLLLSMLLLGSFAACGGDTNTSSSSSSNGGETTKKYDTETRPLVLATDALDGNFNPFFSTSATDVNILSMTQIGMMGADEGGNPVCGQDEATVALDYKVTMLDDNLQETKKAGDAAYTDYEFIIKNGIKFSDGVSLTIKDVLFNLYAYLDPMYMGSATIYSTDIVGLKSYRAQDRDAEQQNAAQLEATFTQEAKDRINAILAYCDDPAENPVTDKITADIEQIKVWFKEEIESDWTNSQGQLESFEENYSFTEDWQVFFFNEGIARVQLLQGTPIRDANNKYVTNLNNLDTDEDGIYEYNPDEPANEVMALALAEDKVQAYMTEHDCTEEAAKTALAKEAATQYVFDSNTALDSQIANILRYWMTGSTALTEFAAQAKDAYFANVSDVIEDISGITTYKTNKDFSGKDLGDEHDVLKVRIYDIDPKAIWNFSFGVAPMHYYSNEETIATTKYGVKFGNYEFFDSVLKSTAKNGLPVGAGVYKASSKDGKNVSHTTFKVNEWVYFERNTYFETVGTELCNAKIKNLRYKIVNSDQLITALEAGEIDYGQPSASVANVNKVSDINSLYSVTYKTNGYGYVGVNPKHVPDIEVRRAIMKAMDIQSVIDIYYGGTLAEPIYRPMSTTNFAYPKGVERHYSIELTTEHQEILDLVAQAGWTKGADGKLHNEKGESLKIRFTIAGETTDHPALTMFNQAAEFLNECGFDISVGTDVQALSKLASGELAVWAAAWSSTIDPDMYQVYHIDSTATSTKNWGYDVIKADLTGKYSDELQIINDLSVLIDQGREKLSEEERAPIYHEALDLVMELAVEFPTYQRCDLVAFNKDVIKVTSTNQRPSANAGVIDRLWEVDYN